MQHKSDYFEAFLAQLQKQTDQIHDILKGISLVGEVSLRARDKVTAIGEKLSSVLFAYSMRLRALPGVHIDSEEVVITDNRFGEASPLMERTRAGNARRSVGMDISAARLVGIDSHNIDCTDGGERPVHSTLLRHDIPIVEHLCALEAVPERGTKFFAVPVKIKGFGTFPVRAFAAVAD